ncbi:MAG: TIGR00289 family protein, partial [Methanocorpusculum sp.]|nr:TIGR00289 family protein [Methanocorpusculum sp.]
MKLAALTSGGKDSILAIWKAKEAGHEVCAMISVIPENPESYMFHAANLAAVPVMAERSNMVYIPVHTAGETEDEVEDLKQALAAAKETYGTAGGTPGA